MIKKISITKDIEDIGEKEKELFYFSLSSKNEDILNFKKQGNRMSLPEKIKIEGKKVYKIKKANGEKKPSFEEFLKIK
jgi:hypothetical protein